MTKYIYLVRDTLFVNQDGKYDGRYKANTYCKKHGIDPNEIVELHNETELEYYRMLKQLDVKSLSVHQPMLVQQGFNNANDDFIPPVMVSVPFRYVDDKGLHYDWVVGSGYELDSRLINSKFAFDRYYLLSNHYLRLLYKGSDGQFKEFSINEINNVRRMYQVAKHKEVLKQRATLKDEQRFDRLKTLREEGRITESQTKELYKLEEKYG